MPRATGAESASRAIEAGRKVRYEPLTPERWAAFADLFGERGACGGCWCMYWRLSRPDFEQRKGAKNRAAMKRLVDAGRPTGVLALQGERAVGWCAIAPREDYPRLDRSRILAPVDERPVWAAPCFFVERSMRGRGLTVDLLRAAADHARKSGGDVLEGYPVEPQKKPMPAVFAWTGIASAFRRAGFREVARRSDSRPIMRLELVARGRKR